jgi:hypothetical protein
MVALFRLVHADIFQCFVFAMVSICFRQDFPRFHPFRDTKAVPFAKVLPMFSLSFWVVVRVDSWYLSIPEILEFVYKLELALRS